jgi:hypothetical protein
MWPSPSTAVLLGWKGTKWLLSDRLSGLPPQSVPATSCSLCQVTLHPRAHNKLRLSGKHIKDSAAGAVRPQLKRLTSA